MSPSVPTPSWFQMNTDLTIEEAKRVETALRAISNRPSTTPEDFFQMLVQHLAERLGVRHAFVTECTDINKTRVRMLAFWSGDRLSDNAEYGLHGTPCEQVIDGEIRSYPERIQSLFPDDKDLVSLAAEGYLGVPLRDSKGQVQGHLVLIDDKPLEPKPHEIEFVKILASRAGAELERARAHADVCRLNQELMVLAEINRAINRRMDRDDLFGRLASSLRAVVPTERFGIELPIEGGTKLQGHILSMRQEGVAPTEPTVLPARGTACDRVMQSRDWVVTGSREEVRELYPVTYQVMGTIGMESLIALPLVSGRRACAALFFMTGEKDAYCGLRREFLEQVAGAVAVALDNCLAHEELRRKMEEEKARLEVQNVYLQEEIKGSHNFEELIGSSTSLKKVLKNIERVAPTNSTVLITGETGTGKELIARAIHNLSSRKDRVLVKVNCAAIPAGLIESELFGHEKGAFTGALTRKMGRFEVADKGTIFLDEVGEMPLDLQSKLLRVLQEGEFERVGGTQTFKVNVRVVAATNRNLEQLSKSGQYRPDLYYRLNVFPIHLPPLREREGDIPLLVQYFTRKFSANLGKKIENVSERMMTALQRYQWPGNIRELEHVIERAVILSEGQELEPIDWFTPSANKVDNGTVLTLEEMERQHILDVLEQTIWRVSGKKGAAAILGLKPTTLEARMKKLGIERQAKP